MKILLNIDSQLFLLNLGLGVDEKKSKKFSKAELDQIKEDQIQMVILAL